MPGYLIPTLRGKYLDGITRAAIVRIDKVKKAESSASRANRYLVFMWSLFNRAERIWEWVDKAQAVTL